MPFRSLYIVLTARPYVNFLTQKGRRLHAAHATAAKQVKVATYKNQHENNLCLRTAWLGLVQRTLSPASPAKGNTWRPAASNHSATGPLC